MQMQMQMHLLPTGLIYSVKGPRQFGAVGPFYCAIYRIYSARFASISIYLQYCTYLPLSLSLSLSLAAPAAAGGGGGEAVMNTDSRG